MTRFIRRGTTIILFSPALANPATATRAELTSATKLSDDVAEVSGWMLENQAVSTPDMGSTFDSSIPGIDQASDSSLTFYEDDTTDVIEALLIKGVTGFIIILRKGDLPGSESMDIFPVQVASRSPEYSAGNDPARFMVRFTITETPALDVTIPAAAA